MGAGAQAHLAHATFLLVTAGLLGMSHPLEVVQARSLGLPLLPAGTRLRSTAGSYE